MSVAVNSFFIGCAFATLSTLAGQAPHGVARHPGQPIQLDTCRGRVVARDSAYESTDRSLGLLKAADLFLQAGEVDSAVSILRHVVESGPPWARGVALERLGPALAQIDAIRRPRSSGVVAFVVKHLWDLLLAAGLFVLLVPLRGGTPVAGRLWRWLMYTTPFRARWRMRLMPGLDPGSELLQFLEEFKRGVFEVRSALEGQPGSAGRQYSLMTGDQPRIRLVLDGLREPAETALEIGGLDVGGAIRWARVLTEFYSYSLELSAFPSRFGTSAYAGLRWGSQFIRQWRVTHRTADGAGRLLAFEVMSEGWIR